MEEWQTTRARFSFTSKRSVLRGRFDQNHMPSVRLGPMVFLFVFLAFTPVFGQDADSDRLIELLKTVP